MGKLEYWAAYGTIENDCRDAITSIVDTPDMLDLKEKVFVLIGAGSAMGPLPMLLACGATVVAIDIPGEGMGFPSWKTWERIISRARDSPGKLIFPLSKPQDECADDEALFKA